jgi:uncharacterized protein
MSNPAAPTPRLMARPNVTDHDLEAVKPIFEAARTIAVVGFHGDAQRPAHYVPAYMASQGYRIIPVNPKMARDGGEFLQVAAQAQLAQIGEAVDIVNVFRNSAAVAEHLDDILAMQPRPALVWLQLGIENQAVAAQLRAVGIEVVQNRCLLADHHKLGLPPRSQRG